MIVSLSFSTNIRYPEKVSNPLYFFEVVVCFKLTFSRYYVMYYTQKHAHPILEMFFFICY